MVEIQRHCKRRGGGIQTFISYNLNGAVRQQSEEDLSHRYHNCVETVANMQTKTGKREVTREKETSFQDREKEVVRERGRFERERERERERGRFERGREREREDVEEEEE